ncbi:phosphoprotein [Jingmen Crocidura shantungensis henipavirus 1]|nr:phosphoprotein [Jingmen Crocidura shantungensis henipavirus 1]
MSYDDKLKQIDQGLAAIDYINQLRKTEVEKRTYGRSAIGLPKIKDRAQAWELFINSVPEETGHEEGGIQSTDEGIGEGDRPCSGHDENDPNTEVGREFRESTWEDSDDIILEDELVTYIPKHDKGRKASNGQSNHEAANVESDMPGGNRKGNGGAVSLTESMPIILEDSADQAGFVDDEDTEERLNELARWLEESDVDSSYNIHDQKATEQRPPLQDQDISTTEEEIEEENKHDHNYPKTRPGTPIPKHRNVIKHDQGASASVPEQDIADHNAPKRLKAITTFIKKIEADAERLTSVSPAVNSNDKQDSVIKKGIEKNISSVGTGKELKSKNGATPHAQKSDQMRGSKDVPVGHVQPTAMTQSVMESCETELPVELNNTETFDTYIEQVVANTSEADRFKILYKSQLDILVKLETLEVLFSKLSDMDLIQQDMRNRVDSLDRSIGKLGLSISLIEQMISSMRIMIPGTPVVDSKIDRNPTLLPIVGRKGQKVNDIVDIDMTQNLNCPFKAKSNLILEPLDMAKTNASQFITVCDKSTKNALYGLIINRVKDIDIRGALLEKLEESETDNDIRELHKIIKEVIDGNL